jgi:peptidyl-prolyl cis-trans isomerase B (cyclophilin B)
MSSKFRYFLIPILLILLSFASTPLSVAQSSLPEVKQLNESKELPFEVPRNPMVLPATARIETTKGPFVIKLYRTQTPISVTNFVHLAKKGFYDGVAFHYFAPGFVIQGGDPSGTKKGGPGWTLPPELRSEVKHKRGALGWARLHAQVNPSRRSNGSQFYITLRAAPDLDGFYTVFAQVVRGMKTVELLRKGDRILAIRFPRERRQGNPPLSEDPAANDTFSIKQAPKAVDSSSP